MIPFSEDELKVIGSHVAPSHVGPMPGASRDIPMFNTPITPKENLRRCVAREEALWIPSSRDFLDYEPRVHPDNVARAFIMDNGEAIPEDQRGGLDMFGVDWVYVPTVGGSMPRPGVKPLLEDVNDWPEKVKFPDVDSFDWAAAAEKNGCFSDSARAYHTCILNGLFERLISFMEFEGAAMAIIDEDQEDAIHALFDRLIDLYIDIIEHHLVYAKLDGVLMHDDWGSQRAPFFSPNVARKMIAPHIRRFSDWVHSKGMWFELHSCGKNDVMTPVYIEAGVDIWRPQPLVDVPEVHAQYGDRIILGYWFDITAKSSDEEIDAAVKEFVAKFAPTFREKPVIAVAFAADQRFFTALYRESRKALAALAEA